MERKPVVNAVKRGRPRKSADAAPSPDQLRRLEFIERAALWAGRIGRRAVATTFGVSVNHVSLDFQRYRAMAPHNLSYDITEKCFRPTKQFKPIFEIDDPAKLLTTIAATAWLPDQERGRLLGFALPVDRIPPFSVAIDRELLASICRCITAGTALQINYQSLSTPEPVCRYFVPHALIFTGQRWLVRGWDGRHNAYRDLALARFISAIETSSTESIPRDDNWFELVRLDLVSAKGLSPGQAAVTAREYGMRPDGQGGYLIEFESRRALVPYVLDYLRLRPNDALDAASPLHLQNYSEIAEFDRTVKSK